MRFEILNSFRKPFIVSVLFLLVVILPITTQAQSAAPFLYYYDQQAKAFVIEQADGSHRRVLANFAMSPQTGNGEIQNIITGPGWSPSGKWFAWRESTDYGGVSPAYIVSHETAPIAILKGIDVAIMQWSPVADFLMVGVQASTQQPFSYDIYVIDMANVNTPIFISEGDLSP